MTRIFLLALALVVLTDCGIKRPLMPPKDIPAFEEKQRKKRERLEDKADDDDADDKAPNAPKATTQPSLEPPAEVPQ